MVVGNLDVIGVAFLPAETNSPLIVDAYAVLMFPVPCQLLQAIPRWDPQIVEGFGGIKHHKFSKRCAL